MRRWKYNGLILGQTVNAHIEEAAHCQAQNGKYDYQKYFHGCLLWTYHGLKSIVAPMKSELLPGVVSFVIASSRFIGTKQYHL
jgi:hypothetical protein